MIWLFERGRGDLWIESLYDNVTGEYVLTLRRPDGGRSVERFPDSQTLETRLVDLEGTLEADCWDMPATLNVKDSWSL